MRARYCFAFCFRMFTAISLPIEESGETRAQADSEPLLSSGRCTAWDHRVAGRRRKSRCREKVSEEGRVLQLGEPWHSRMDHAMHAAALKSQATQPAIPIHRDRVQA